MPEDTAPDPAPMPPRRGAIRTPCVKVCVIEPMSGLCVGCGRSLREIGAWTGYSDAQRTKIMASLKERLNALRAAHPEAFMD